jgi:hypothetical protein
MTGGEVVAVGKAAAKAASDDKSVKQQLLDIAKDTPAANLAAESYARRLAIRQAFMLRLFSPLARWMGIRKEFFQAEFAEEMAARTAHIPEDQLVTPLPSLAVPAIEGLGYSIDEPNLRDMYLNLLATASNAKRSDEAHPSFPTIIKQLSASEASLLLHVIKREDHSIAQVFFYSATNQAHGGYNITARNLIQIPGDKATEWAYPSVAMWIDNWVRLGLVEPSWTESLANPTTYDWANSCPEFLAFKNLPPEVGRAEIKRGVLRPTSLGRIFAAAVEPDPAAGQVVDVLPEAREDSPEQAPG